MSDDYDSMLEHLADDTLDGKLKWHETHTADVRVRRDNVNGFIYVARLDDADGDQNIAIYEVRVPSFDEDGEIRGHDYYVTAELVSDVGTLKFELPSSQGAARSLLDAVRRQTSGADALLRKYLSRKKK